MRDMTPRCPHCQNLTIVGSIAERLVAVCTACDNGFSVAGRSYTDLMNYPSQQYTRHQVSDVITKVMNHLSGIAGKKQDELLAASVHIPADPEKWTHAHKEESISLQSQRMVYAGLLQGASSFRDLTLKAFGLGAMSVADMPTPAAHAPVSPAAPAVTGTPEAVVEGSAVAAPEVAPAADEPAGELCQG